MAKTQSESGTEVVQVHLSTPLNADGHYRNWVTWIPADVKPKAGQKMTCGKDATVWTIEQAYTSTPTRMEGVNSGWRVL